MKVLQSHSDQLAKVYFPILLGIALFFFLRLLDYIAFLSAIFLLHCLVLIFSRWGNIRLGEKPRKLSQLFINILSLQIFVTLAFYLLYFIFSQTSGGTLQLRSFHWIYVSLYPWSLYTLVACILLYWQHKTNKQNLILTALVPVFGKYTQSVIGMGINIFIRQAIIFSLSLILMAAIAVSLTLIMQSLAIKHALTLSVHTFLLYGLLFVSLMSPAWATVQRFFWKINCPLARMLLLQSLVILIVLSVASLLLVKFDPSLFVPLNLSINEALVALYKPYAFNLLLFTWWLSLTPVVTFYLRQWYQGQSIRSALLLTLLTPAITLALYYWLPQPIITLGLSYQKTLLSLSIVCIIIFYSFNKDIEYLLLNTMYEVKHLHKKRLPLKIYQGSCPMIMLFLLLFHLFGIIGLSVFYVAITGTCLAIFFLQSLGWWREMLS